jgi:hypothetical protein
MMRSPTTEIWVETAQGFTPLDVKPATAAPIQMYQPRPGTVSRPQLNASPIPGSFTRDTSIPNYVNVADIDWTAEVDQINRSIHQEFQDMGNSAVAQAEWDAYNRRRSRAQPPQNARYTGAAIAAAGAAIQAGTEIAQGGDVARAVGGATGAAIGGIAGTAVGGAIGTVLGGGPWGTFVGAQLGGLAGGILGDWIGRAVGDLVTPDGDGMVYGNQGRESLISGGQSAVSYNVVATYSVYKDDGSPHLLNQTGFNTLTGPIGPPVVDGYANGTQFYIGYKGWTRNWIVAFNTEYNIVVDSVVCTRADGQPDTGGDYYGDPVTGPVNQPGVGPGNRDFGDPFAPTVPRIRRPNLPGFPNLPNPFGGTHDGPVGTQPFVPIIPELPGLPDFPTNLPSGEDGTDGRDGEQLTCCEKVEAIHGYFQVSGRESVNLATCGAEEADPREWEGAGLSGVYRALEVFSDTLEAIWSAVKCGEGGAIAIPEWWAVRPGADVPQLALTFRAEAKNSYWGMTIPHYNKGPDFKPQIPKYSKGSYFTTLTLTDNTKLVINAKTFAEGERVVNALIPLINPAFLSSPPNIHQGRRKGASLTEAVVIPTKAAFYPRGQQSNRPAWFAEIIVV